MTFFFSLLILIAGIGLSLFVGASSTLDDQIFWMLRLPRTICGVAVGGGLAIAGTIIQSSLGNPLADPYTLGIAAAAALGAVIGSLVPFTSSWLSLGSSGIFAFLFSIGSLFLLATWLRRGFRHSMEVLLAGVVMGLFFSALATLILALADPDTWTSSVGWMMGKIENLSLSEALVALLFMFVAFLLGWAHWKPLDLMATDELAAESAGVDVERYRRRLFFLTAFITAVSVAISGVVGFLGLIVPHFLRRMGVRGHFLLLPAAFTAGAGLFLCSDVLARMVVRPSEIPVGVIMAMIGAPVFLVLVRTQRKIS